MDVIYLFAKYQTDTHTHTHTERETTGETLHMSYQEKSALSDP